MVVESPEGKIEISGKKYQVIGTFRTNYNKELHDKIVKDSNNTSYIDNNISTTIKNVTPGRIAFNNEKSVKSLYYTSEGTPTKTP